jgi:hypothetical protein
MEIKSVLATTIIAASTALMATSLPAAAMTRGQFAAQEQHRVANDMSAAQTALAAGNRLVAMNNAANAETILLNAQQFGGYENPATLAALKQTHDAFAQGKLQAATGALKIAQNDLTMIG